MSTATVDRAALAHLLPDERVGAVTAIEPISVGLSGAGVYAVTAARGDFILRVQAGGDAARWAQQLRIHRRAAERAVAPEIVHVDEAASAIVSRRVLGAPLAAALADPGHRGAAIASVVAQLRALHGLDAADVAVSDPVGYGRAQLAAQRSRPGYPAAAAGLDHLFDDIEEVLARDPRRVVSHNDLNPGNLLWDGARVWLVDWDVAGLAHPYYDLAVLALFLQLDDATAHHLLAAQEQRPMGEGEGETFAALRRAAALLLGLTFLGMVPDLGVLPGSAPTLSDCYADMRTGALDLQQPSGRGAFGLALLDLGLRPPT